MRTRPPRWSLVRAALAVALSIGCGAVAAPAVLACTVESGPVPVSSVVTNATVAVDGKVSSASGGGDAPVLIEVSVDRVLKGATAEPLDVHDEGTCPFYPAAGDRVIVAATADGQLIGAWGVNGAQAYPWIPTTPQLTTVAAVDAAFGLPQTSTSDAEPASAITDSGLPLALLFEWLVITGVALLAFARRRPA